MSRSVAIVIESFGGGGAQHVASTLANAWAARGVKVVAITLQGPASDVFRLDHRIDRVVIGGSGQSRGLFAAVSANLTRLWRLRAALRASSADLVLSFVGSTNVLTVLASRGLGQRVLIAERNDPARQSLGRGWDALRRWTYGRADVVIANSKAAIETMAQYVPRERLLWLPNPLRSSDIALATTGLDSGPFVLAVGRLHPQKAFDVLLEAFAIVVSRRPDLRLVILGDGPARVDLERQAAKLGISPSVRFAGHVADPFPWYRSATVLAHPARFEGLPNAVLEAMSVALPVIVTDAQEGLREFVNHDASGLAVPPDDPAALADAMLRLDGDESLRRRLGENAQQAVQVCRADRAIAAWTSALGLGEPA